ncbi:hypothetical protein ACH46N_27165 [Streptomyces pristinaespiralis]|jgi:hypothetical protein|uniref:Secreted protein n=2 Tax=Streptomyces pristinaespiralis TaxID=38300 RepID=B5HKK1_STRE2|nr:hypothetical protein [Streptomyces pristinaespiralis]ALC21184.1 secreted protein [Streptomyces pristinaespiralis]EDY67362.2 conserved hypothetical protein [Streptomyces pristinaespiralis ATCC 25486]QMU16063.1 hypothetical protein H3L99_22635 [Streptomyces pristinaespiralis]
MKLTTRGTLAAVLACVGTAVAAAPAVAGTSVPVVLPLESLETAVPVETPDLSTGVPVPVPGAPEGPRHVTGTLLPQGTLPAVPVSSELPRTLLEVPVENPLGEGNLGVAEVLAQESDVELASPGASLGAPVTAPSGEGFGLPEPTLPEAALVAPVLRAAPTGTLLFR